MGQPFAACIVSWWHRPQPAVQELRWLLLLLLLSCRRVPVASWRLRVCCVCVCVCCVNFGTSSTPTSRHRRGNAAPGEAYLVSSEASSFGRRPALALLLPLPPLLLLLVGAAVLAAVAVAAAACCGCSLMCCVVVITAASCMWQYERRACIKHASRNHRWAI